MTNGPHDHDRREDDLPAPIRAELEALRVRHRHDWPVRLVSAADVDALPDQLQDAAARLKRDAWQRALLEGLDQADASLSRDEEDRLLARVKDEVRRAGATRRARLPKTWAPVLALAAAALIVTSVVFLMRVPVVPPGETGATPSAAPAPAFVLPLDKPDVKLTAGGLVRRSADRSAKFLDEIAPAMNAYRAGDYATAVSEFTRVAPMYPGSVEIPFYLGMAKLLSGDSAGALASLDAARKVADETFAPDVSWYLAVAAERAGQPAVARSALDALCKGTSPYAARACDAVARLKG